MNKTVFSSTQWSIRKTKLAVCIPCRDTLHSAHALCLAEMIKLNTMSNIDTQIFMDASTILLNQRNNLVNMALDAETNYILWLDSDIIFPSTLSLRLLSHNENIVAGNYVTRQVPNKSVAFPKFGIWDNTLKFEEKSDLIDVEAIGFGCVMMKTSIFKEISSPWFEFSWSSEFNTFQGEDINLSKKLIDLGYKIKVDNMISKELRHLGTYAFSSKDIK